MQPSPVPAPLETLVPHAMLRERGTIVVADLVESVRLIERDEAGTVARWQALTDAVVHRLLPGTGGRLVKSLGDGMMLSFPDTRRAVGVAFAIQHECARLNDGVEPSRRLWLRIGAHVGEHVADALDVYGHSVNLAARVATLAGPGEIVVTADVRDQVTASLDADIEDLGECWLKHVSQPVRAYRLGPPGPEPVIDAADGAQALKPTIAVIPFAGLAVPPEHAVLGEVIADEVIGSLSRSMEVNVISRLSTTSMRGRSDQPAALAERLGASYVLAGHYRTMGARIDLVAELHEVSTSRIVWADTLRGKTAGVVWGDSPLLSRLEEGVRVALVARSLERARGHSLPTLETFALMLAGIALMHRLSPSDFDRARNALALVAERAPRQAAPLAWLAQWYVLRLIQGWSDDTAGDARRASEHSRRALDLDPHCSLALAIDGLVATHFTHRFDLAAERFEQALSANPNDPIALANRGMLAAFQGRGAPALRDTHQAVRLSPLDPMRYYYDSLCASAALAADQPARAIRLARRSLKANRLHASTLRVLAIAQWRTGAFDDARHTVDSLRRQDPGLTASGWLARSPSRDHEIGRTFAQTLREAGLPD
jgi:adenylate cyclase